MMTCYMKTGKENIIKTYWLTEKDVASFCVALCSYNEVAAKAIRNAELFYEQIASYVKQFVVIASGSSEVIRRSGIKTGRHGAQSSGLFLNKGMLPEEQSKDKNHQQSSFLIPTRDQMVKFKIFFLSKVHRILNRPRIKAKKETLITKRSFQNEVQKQTHKSIEQIEVVMVEAQIHSLLKNFESDKKIAAYFRAVSKVAQLNEVFHMGRIKIKESKIGRITLEQYTPIAKRYSKYLINTFCEKPKIKRDSTKAIIATKRKFLNLIFYIIINNWVFRDFVIFKFPYKKSS